LASDATVSLFGPTTTAVAVAPTWETALSTWQATTGRRSCAAPSDAPNACGYPRRPRARWQGRCVYATGALRGALGARRPHIRVRRNGKGGMRKQALGKILPIPPGTAASRNCQPCGPGRGKGPLGPTEGY
jgi:hypothetical protein